MKLEVGMYVRTKKGNVGKIIKITKECIFFDRVMYQGFIKTGLQTKYLYKDKIDIYVIKASHNIIDLIEVGDYVNGYPVKSQFGSNAVCLDINYQKQGIDQIVKEQDIKSIVTKEQFESMSYKL